MNRYVNIGLSCAMAALIASTTVALSAQQTTPAGRGRGAAPATTTPPPPQGGDNTARPARRGGGGSESTAQPQKMGDQSTPITATVTNLGPVHIARAVKADGQPLPAGTYQVRVTEREASPAAAGQTPQYERWAEFLQGGQVKGREVVTVVPQADIAKIADDKLPKPGSYRGEVLKGGDYYRLWYNRGGTHYLVHFNIA